MITSDQKRIGDVIAVKIGIPIRITVPLLLFGSAAIFSILYILKPEWHEELKFTGAAVGIATALQSAYFAKRALESAVYDRQLNAASDYFFKFYFDLNSQRMAFRKLSSSHLHGKNATDLIAVLSIDENATVVTPLLNFWEGVGYSVRKERIPVAFVCDLMGSACLTTFDEIQPWLSEHRRARRQPTAFEHFEWLAAEIRKHRAANGK